MRVTEKRSYAFVVPRCKEGIAGGVETLMGQLAAKLHERGDTVEIFTTCAVDNRSWENELPEGPGTEYGVSLRRFPVDERNLDAWIPLQINISEGMNLTIEDELDWMMHGVSSKKMYEVLLEEADMYDAIFFGPYLFGTTFWGSLLRPDKSVLIPCLHDE